MGNIMQSGQRIDKVKDFLNNFLLSSDISEKFADILTQALNNEYGSLNLQLRKGFSSNLQEALSCNSIQSYFEDYGKMGFDAWGDHKNCVIENIAYILTGDVDIKNY